MQKKGAKNDRPYQHMRAGYDNQQLPSHARAHTHRDVASGRVNCVVEDDSFAGAATRLTITIHAVLRHVEQVAAGR